jgi:hypothetical protein
LVSQFIAAHRRDEDDRLDRQQASKGNPGNNPIMAARKIAVLPFSAIGLPLLAAYIISLSLVFPCSVPVLSSRLIIASHDHHHDHRSTPRILDQRAPSLP